MKINSLPLNLLVLVFSFFLLTSCEEKKSDKKTEPQEVNTSELVYQCPMDCEKGKTYHEEGSCPVCKMDLKEASEGHSKACKMNEGGECSCKADKCKCKDCKKHADGKTCEKDKDGNCICKECKCENCKEQASAMTCKKDKDGNCNCKKGECECVNCAEHS